MTKPTKIRLIAAYLSQVRAWISCRSCGLTLTHNTISSGATKCIHCHYEGAR